MGGELKAREELACAYPGGTGPRHIARVSNEHIVVSGELSNELYLCTLDLDHEREWKPITIAHTESCFEEEVRDKVTSKDSIHTMAHVAVHGNLVFASNRGMDCICVF